MERKQAFTSSLIYFIIVCVFVVIRMMSQFGLFSFMGEIGGYVLNVVLQVGFLLLFSFFMFKTLNKQKARDTLDNFGYHKISWKVILISVAIGMIIYFLNIFVSSFFFNILTSVGYKPSSSSSTGTVNGWTLVLGLIFTAILPAVCEENLHRGMLLFGNRGIGMKNNILLTGLMFGLLHLNIEQFFYATLIGIFLGFVAYVSESIYPCMIIHFMNNGISVLLSYLSRTGATSGGVITYINELLQGNPIGGFIFVFFLVLVLVFCLMYLVKLLIRMSFEENIKSRQKFVLDLATKINFLNDVNKIKTDKKDDEKMVDTDLAFMSIEDMKTFLQNHPDAIVVPKTKKQKMEVRTKILIIASIVLSAAITLFTFIWGLL